MYSWLSPTRYGAPLSGAVVTVGGKSITTGTDGTASFSLKRGSYVAQVACTGYSAQSVQLSVTDSIPVSAYSSSNFSKCKPPGFGRLFCALYRRMGIGRKSVKTAHSGLRLGYDRE